MIHYDHNTNQHRNIQLNPPKLRAVDYHRHQKATDTVKSALLTLVCFAGFIAIIFATMIISTN